MYFDNKSYFKQILQKTYDNEVDLEEKLSLFPLFLFS